MLKRMILAGGLLLSAPIAAAGPTLQPGLWQTTVTIKSVTMPNAPASMMRAMQGHTTNVKQCVTAQDAARGPHDLLKSAPSCRFTRYAMAGGRFSAAMSCAQGGGSMNSTVIGAFTPTSFSADSNVVMTGGAGMTMASRITSRRLSDCR
jgi:hypothetical protein